MRVIGRLLLLLLLLPPLWWLGDQVVSRWPQVDPVTTTPIASSQSEQRTVFVLDAEQWTEFALPPQSDLLRVSSRVQTTSEPDGDAATAEAPDDIRYRIDYRFDDGPVRSFYLRSRGPRPDEPRQLRGARDAAPLSRQRNIYLARPDASAARLALRWTVETASNVDWLAVEVAAKIGRADEASALLWQRVRDSVRRDVARASITPLSLLSRAERSRLLSHGWQPLGPEGIAGRDYEAEVVYVAPALNEDSAEAIAGMPVAPGRALALLIERAGPARLIVSGTDEAELSLTSHAEKPIPPIVIKGAGEHPVMLSAGLLEIQSDTDAAVQLFDEDGTALAFEFSSSPYYLLQPNAPLRYSVADAGGSLRVEVRGLTSEQYGLSTVGAVDFRWLGRDDRVLAAGQLTLPIAFAEFDRLQSPLSTDAVTVGQRNFLTIPVAAQQLEFMSSTVALVAVRSRPRNLAWRRPSNQLRDGQRDDAVAVPAWFIVEPDQHAELMANQRRLLVRRQPPIPISPEPGAEPDRYEWQAVALAPPARPQRSMLVPAELGRPGPTAFVPLRSGWQELQLSNPAAVTLSYIKAQSAPVAVSVRWRGAVDGGVERTVAGQVGQIRLPQLPAGSIELELKAEGGQWWANWLWPTNSTEVSGMRRREAYPLDQTPLAFNVDKQSHGREVVNLETFLADSGPTPAVEAELEIAQRAPRSLDYTLSRRRLELLSDSEFGLTGRVLFSDGQQTTAAQHHVVVLGEDLPPGRYKLTLTPSVNLQGWVSAYQLRRDVDLLLRSYRQERPE